MLGSFEWRDLDEPFAIGILRDLFEVDRAVLESRFRVKGRAADLPFYKKWVLLEITAWPNDYADMPETLYALWAIGHRPQLLDGSNTALYEANEDEHLELSSEDLPAYIRYFLFVVRADEGAFAPFEKAPAGVPAGAEKIAAMASPLASEGVNEKGEHLYRARIIYAGHLFDSLLATTRDGEMSMVDDEPLVADVPPALVPDAPTFRDGSWIRANLPADVPSRDDTPPISAIVDELHDHQPRAGGRRRAAKAAPSAAATAASKTAIELMAELLLSQALVNQSKNRLIDHFNARTPTTGALERFAALMVDTSPIVVMETTIPYIERVIAKIIDERTPSDLDVIEGRVESEDGPMSFGLPRSGPAVVLIPYSINRKIAEVERLVFDMASRNIGALISCERANQLSPSLQQAQDIVLTLPALTPELFATLFEKMFGASPPGNWRRRAHEWVKYVQHTDFDHPRRMNLAPADALAYIRGDVQDRLAVVDTRRSMRLSELHGLGEARQWAEDLIADIHAAMNGKLPWAQVDAGVLLAGAPGTGKTTLANAIARDCGIRFVRASATSWMAEGIHLGPHLQAIQRTFREARAYSPSILFIDEIDGLGSRERFGADNNSIYQTEIVNAVLEQMQGIDPAAPVFVIGATNHVDHVDPALRRSGRLDRVIVIPRPNTEALQLIYRHYLKELAPDVEVERGVNLKVLAGLSVGLTGADVQRIVRGAARQARKEQRPLRESDVADEITGRSRRTTETLRLTPDELERTAIHEAGHALAAFLGPSRGTDIGFTSVLPRDDGTLGFVAPLPSPRMLLTRKDYEDTLEVWLAGRAAEELQYGADQIANGSSVDLQRATSLVTALVTRSGLNGNGSLFVSDEMTDLDRATAVTMLNQAYDRVLRKLRKEEAMLTALATELVTKQELTGSEVRAVLRPRSQRSQRARRSE